jgi:hypothetical protein
MAFAAIVKLLLIGCCVGVASGTLGIGGGVMVIPALVLLLGFSQQRAVGTSLAMLLPPIGLFAVLRYARAGHVDWSAALTMAAGFALGAYGGAWLASRGVVSERTLRLMFVGFLLYIAGNMLFRGERRVWAALCTVGLAAVYGITYLAMRALGRRWERSLNLAESYRARLDEPMAPEYEI